MCMDLTTTTIFSVDYWVKYFINKSITHVFFTNLPT